MKPPRIVIMGVSGCGKSTVGVQLAQRLGVSFLEGDALHPPRNIELMRSGIALTDEDRREWLDAIGQRLQALADDEGLVIACSALKRSYRDRLRQACADLLFVHLHGRPALIAQRLAQRQNHYMPSALLESQFATLEAPDETEAAWSFDIESDASHLVDRISQQLQEHTT